METYSPASTENSLFELQIDHEISSHLTQTAKWAKFLAIVGFVGCGFLLIMVLFLGSMATSLSAFGGVPSSAGFAQVLLLVAMVVLYFFPCLFLLQFANKMLLAIRNNDQYNLTASFRQLKLCFKYIGIVTLVVISIYVLAFLFGLMFAASRF
ncbi:MAG TPA: hypothetical protein VIM79_10085 [Niastella sp.]